MLEINQHCLETITRSYSFSRFISKVCLMHYRKLVSNLDEMNNNYDITAKNKRRFGVVSSIHRLSSTQRMPVNQRIQDGGWRPPVLKGSRLAIMLRHHPRWRPSKTQRRPLVNHVTSPSKMAAIQDSKMADSKWRTISVAKGRTDTKGLVEGDFI